MTRLTFNSVASQFSVMGYELAKASKGYKENSGHSKEKFANLQTALDWVNQQVSLAPVKTVKHPNAFVALLEEITEKGLTTDRKSGKEPIDFRGYPLIADAIACDVCNYQRSELFPYQLGVESMYSGNGDEWVKRPDNAPTMIAKGAYKPELVYNNDGHAYAQYPLACPLTDVTDEEVAKPKQVELPIVEPTPTIKTVLNSFEAMYKQFVPKRATLPAIGFSQVVAASSVCNGQNNQKIFKGFQIG